MSISPHRLAHDLYRGPKVIADPGNGGSIRANADLQVCELTSGASNETRTLENPTKPGIRFIVRLVTDGGGDIVLTAANGLNAALVTVATLADAGDMLSMISVSLTATTYRWEVLVRNGVTMTTSTSTATATSSSTSTSTATATSTSTATPSATGTSTSSATLSASGTKTATPSATASSTSTSTSSATATQTSTKTATGTGTSSSTGTATATATQ